MQALTCQLFLDLPVWSVLFPLLNSLLRFQCSPLAVLPSSRFNALRHTSMRDEICRLHHAPATGSIHYNHFKRV